MGRKRDLVVAGFFGAFGLILTYLLTDFLSVPGGFRIDLGVGAGLTLLIFAGLFSEGVRSARRLDGWEEKQKEAYLNRFALRVLTASGVSECNLYLYPDHLIMVSRRKLRETVLRREEITDIMAGTEDTEIICDRKAIYSLDVGEGSEAAKTLLNWYRENKAQEE